MSIAMDPVVWARAQAPRTVEQWTVLCWLAKRCGYGGMLHLFDDDCRHDLGVSLEMLDAFELYELRKQRLIAYADPWMQDVIVGPWEQRVIGKELGTMVWVLYPGSDHELAPPNPCADMTVLRRKPKTKKHLYLDPCAYCGGVATALDHIVPRAAGGRDERGMNLTAVCKACNSSKGKRPLLQWLASRKVAA